MSNDVGQRITENIIENEKRFFESPPPGPDGYIVIAQRSPWPKGLGEPPQAWLGDREWSRDHLRRFHGWDEEQIEAYMTGNLAGKGPDWDAHSNDHGLVVAFDFEQSGGDIPIPHVHEDGVAWAIAHDHLIYRTAKRALITMLRYLNHECVPVEGP